MDSTCATHRHYPCSHRGYTLKKQIGRGSYGKVYKAHVCDLDWEKFHEAAKKNGVSQSSIDALKTAGFEKTPQGLLEVSDDEMSNMEGIKKDEIDAIFKAVVSSRTETKDLVAIKILNEDCNDWQTVQQEIHIMHDIHHANIVRVYSAFLRNGAMDQIWVVMPLLAIGSLRTLMREIPEFKCGIKDPKLLAAILKQTISALAYLHEDGRAHRDLKASNILMSEDGEVKLGDFGVTSDRCLSTMKSFVGTACFMAPEIIASLKTHGPKADIWSFGITALELAYGHAPYAYLDNKDCFELTLHHPAPSCRSYSKRHKRLPRSFQKMVEKCLQKNPKNRPTANQILSEAFLKNAKGSEYIAEHCIKPILEIRKKDCCEEEKEIDSGADDHRLWMIPCGSFRLPKTVSDERKKQGTKLVRQRSGRNVGKENKVENNKCTRSEGTILMRSETQKAKSQKRWRWFLRHLAGDDADFSED